MAKPRKQTYTTSMYLDKIKDMDIRSDADVQRAAGQWNNEQINELIYTVLTEDYIPPIIIGEESNGQLWIIDGLQRSTTLMMYRYGNYKITSAIGNSVISYRAKSKDENGKIVVDANGDIVWDEVEFDIRNKTYDELPDELKKRFNEYQIETVIHEDCDMNRISMLIKRYNSHTSMNTVQKAMTYISHFARDVRNILNTNFFVNCGVYTEKDRVKGNLERVVLESIMCTNYLDSWKKQTKSIANHLDQNASKEMFEKFNDNLSRLENVVTDDMRDVFNIKDSFIWLTLFDRFTYLNIDDCKFVDFLRAFKNGLRNNAVDGILFDKADEGKGTKDKSVIIAKLHILETLMNEFLGVCKDEDGEEANVDVLEFVKENVNVDATEEDVEFYSDMLEDLTLSVDNNSKLMEDNNKPSMIAAIGYACENDIDLDDWIGEYFANNQSYIQNQRDNYIRMISHIQQFENSKVQCA